MKSNFDDFLKVPLEEQTFAEIENRFFCYTFSFIIIMDTTIN